ncbi:MAG: hypothetical protein M1839_005057 [Geoglossum umbratile]|nr:MAG: hypothetical protein M1839_005057 [Geoglossum umbratile]
MLEEPSEDKIESLLQMGVASSRDEAIMRLKENGNDVERTIDSIFVRTETQQQNPVWDDTFFTGSDRNGHVELRSKGEGVWADTDGFAIHHAPDSLQPNVFGPPTRPPSRNDRETIDLTREYEAADPSMSMSVEAREAADMERALNLSRNDMIPQESGVTHFGPATRPHYNDAEWAVATVGSGAHEVIPNPDPADRRRALGEPAFLKPSPSAHTLASFITILHAIPLARRALLFQDYLLPDYGHNDEWWDGTPATVLKIVSFDDCIQAEGDEDEIIFETQRLLAFLTKTTRAYGSAEVLANTEGVRSQNLDIIVGDYLENWHLAAKRLALQDTPPEVFRTVAIHYEGERKTHPVFLFNLCVDENQTLYDVIDDALWAEVDEDREETYFEQNSEVFSLLLKGTNANHNGIGIRIPTVLYLDRYMESSKSLAKEMRSKKAGVKRRIQEIEQLEARLTEAHSPGVPGGPYDPRVLLQAAAAQLTRPTPPKQANGVSEGDVESEFPQTHPNDNTETAQKLKRIYETVLEKLKALEEQKEKAKASLQELSALLTQPSDNPENSPHLRYTLRGITTLPHITYVLIPIAEGETSTPDAALRGEQWWKITFSTDALSTNNANSYYVSSSARAPPTGGEWDVKETTSWCSNGQVPAGSTAKAESGASWVQKVPEVQVLKAAREESQSVILVYASDGAMKASYPSLPPALEKFVEIDNAAFAAELGSTQQPAANNHRSPKRKASWGDEELVPWGGETPTSRARTNGDPLSELSQAKDAVDPNFTAPTDRVRRLTPPLVPAPRNTKGGKMFGSIDEHTVAETVNREEHDASNNTSDQPEMTERSHLSPVARAFKPNIVTINLSERSEDEPMGDADGEVEQVGFEGDVVMM